MKAMVHDSYGSPDVLRLKEIDRPVPTDDEVLVRIRAASVNPQDWHFLTGLPLFMRAIAGLRKPKQPRLGTDWAGEVAAVGRSVTRFKVGDEVFGLRTGAFAEYVCVREDGLIVDKPAEITFEQASTIPVAGITALQGLRDKGQIKPDQRVLINGAAGGVGTYAVQIAKSFGAHVTGVCSTGKVDVVRSLGADRVIDYTKEDFAGDGQRYDLILDNVCTRSLADRKRALAPDGIFVAISGPKTNRLLGPATDTVKIVLAGRFGSAKLLPMLARPNREDLTTLANLLADGTVVPIISGTYSLRELPVALGQVGEGHLLGKAVIVI